MITFLDGEAYIGNVIGTDRDLDIAVVKVEPTNTYLQPENWRFIKTKSW